MVASLTQELEVALNVQLYTTVKKLHGSVRASTVIGFQVHHVRTIEGLILSRFQANKSGKGASQ
jgi:hypothetical protein